MVTKAVDKAANGGQLATWSALGEVERWLTEPGYVIAWPEQDPADAQASINRSIIDGEGDPLASDEQTATKLEDAVGLSFALFSVEFRPSDESSGADAGGAYAILKGSTADGEAIVLVTGSAKVLARCVAIVKRGQLGRWVEVSRGGVSRQGRTFYDLVAGAEPFPA